MAKAQEEEGFQLEAPLVDLSSKERQQEEKIRVMAGGFVDGRAIVAFRVLGSKTGISLNTTISGRCCEILSSQNHVLQDLKLLADHAPDSTHNFPFLLRFYTKALSQYEKAKGQLPSSPASASPPAAPLTFPQALVKTYTVYKKLLLWDILLGLCRV